jgi:hypothetical protein
MQVRSPLAPLHCQCVRRDRRQSHPLHRPHRTWPEWPGSGNSSLTPRRPGDAHSHRYVSLAVEIGTLGTGALTATNFGGRGNAVTPSAGAPGRDARPRRLRHDSRRWRCHAHRHNAGRARAGEGAVTLTGGLGLGCSPSAGEQAQAALQPGRRQRPRLRSRQLHKAHRQTSSGTLVILAVRAASKGANGRGAAPSSKSGRGTA